DDRSVVHDLPGTTRDTIDTVVETPEGPFRFVDTAGMRRKSRIEDGPEFYSLVRALQAIDGAQIALLVVDASEGVTHQDQRPAEPAQPAPGARVLYATQGATDPPTFTLFTNRALPPAYLRYLERRIREHFGFGPTPLKLRVRPRTG